MSVAFVRGFRISTRGEYVRTYICFAASSPRPVFAPVTTTVFPRKSCCGMGTVCKIWPTFICTTSPRKPILRYFGRFPLSMHLREHLCSSAGVCFYLYDSRMHLTRAFPVYQDTAKQSFNMPKTAEPARSRKTRRTRVENFICVCHDITHHKQTPRWSEIIWFPPPSRPLEMPRRTL